MKIKRYKEIGFWTRKKRSWNEELKGLYIDCFTTTTNGGGGIIWKITRKGETFITVSTYGRGVKSRWSGRAYNVYKHYILNKKGIEKLREAGIINDELAKKAFETLKRYQDIVLQEYKEKYHYLKVYEFLDVDKENEAVLLKHEDGRKEWIKLEKSIIEYLAKELRRGQKFLAEIKDKYISMYVTLPKSEEAAEEE
jgi:hypothetical protein